MKSGDSPRGEFADLSLQQVADRLANRELVDAYAYCADRRDAAAKWHFSPRRQISSCS